MEKSTEYQTYNTGHANDSTQTFLGQILFYLGFPSH